MICRLYLEHCHVHTLSLGLCVLTLKMGGSSDDVQLVFGAPSCSHSAIRAVHADTEGPHEDLLTILKRHILQWYGNVSCSSDLAKNILQSTVKRERRQGRQRKRWEDIIREWTGLDFGKSQRAVENREKWRKLVANHLWFPKDPHG